MSADSLGEVLAEAAQREAERIVADEDDRADEEVDAELNERLVAVLADLAAIRLDLDGQPDDVIRAVRVWLGRELAELRNTIEGIRQQ